MLKIVWKGAVVTTRQRFRAIWSGWECSLEVFNWGTYQTVEIVGGFIFVKERGFFPVIKDYLCNVSFIVCRGW